MIKEGMSEREIRKLQNKTYRVIAEFLGIYNTYYMTKKEVVGKFGHYVRLGTFIEKNGLFYNLINSLRCIRKSRKDPVRKKYTETSEVNLENVLLGSEFEIDIFSKEFNPLRIPESIHENRNIVALINKIFGKESGFDCYSSDSLTQMIKKIVIKLLIKEKIISEKDVSNNIPYEGIILTGDRNDHTCDTNYVIGRFIVICPHIVIFVSRDIDNWGLVVKNTDKNLYDGYGYEVMTFREFYNSKRRKFCINTQFGKYRINAFCIGIDTNQFEGGRSPIHSPTVTTIRINGNNNLAFYHNRHQTPEINEFLLLYVMGKLTPELKGVYDEINRRRGG